LETSPLGKILLIFCAILALAAYLFMSLSWIIVSAGLLVVYTYSRNRFVNEVRGSQIEVEHKVLDEVAFSKEPLAVKVEVMNWNSTPLAARFEDRIPDDCTVASGSNIATVTVPPHSVWSYTYSIIPDRRGRHVIGGLDIEQTDSFGLFVHRREIDSQAGISVHTRRESLTTARDIARREHFEYAGLTRTPTVVVREFEHAGIRDYVPGDKARDIHWKAYAKLGKLMTKTYKKEGTLETTVFVDCGRSMRLTTDEIAKIDHAIDLGIQLSRVLLSNFHRTGAIVFDETSIVSNVEASLGKHQFEKIVRGLRETPDSIRTDTRAQMRNGPAPGDMPARANVEDLPQVDSGETFFEVLRTMTRGRPGMLKDMGLEGVISGMIARNRGGAVLFIVISDLISSRDAVLSAARMCSRTGNRMLVIQTYDDWYSRSPGPVDSAEAERLYSNMEVGVKMEAALRRTGASFIRIGPADTTARIVRSVRRGVA
jgi:uncharacterized protein (DUF58 family)